MKLKQWKVSPSDIDKIITKLLSDGFINDERFARIFVRDKSKFNKWGPLKIAYTLKTKRIADEIIEKAMHETKPFQDDNSLHDLLKKKAKTIKAKSTADLRNKLIRFGISRGFNYGKVYEIVDKYF
jgi:regulatory protein